jgi:hypothetical protein
MVLHDDAAPEFWFCLNHHTVEGREGCKAKDRLGPYATRDEAEHALTKVEERNDEADSFDRDEDS